MLNQPKTAEFLLKNLGSDRVVGVLKSILLDVAPEEEPRITNLIKTIVDLRTERNKILHWTWSKGLEDDEAISASARPFREFHYSSKKARQIQQSADEMANVSHALMEWQQFLHKRLARPSPDKPAPLTPPTSSPSP